MKKAYYAIILFAAYGLVWATDHLLHEICGVLLCGLLLVHLLINNGWFRSLFKGRYNSRRKWTAVCNFGFLLFVAAAAVTGMMYSKDLFAGLPFHESDKIYKKIHEMFAYFTVAFLICHTFWHWRVVGGYLKKIMQKIK